MIADLLIVIMYTRLLYFHLWIVCAAGFWLNVFIQFLSVSETFIFVVIKSCYWRHFSETIRKKLAECYSSQFILWRTVFVLSIPLYNIEVRLFLCSKNIVFSTHTSDTSTDALLSSVSYRLIFSVHKTKSIDWIAVASNKSLMLAFFFSQFPSQAIPAAPTLPKPTLPITLPLKPLCHPYSHSSLHHLPQPIYNWN